MTKDSDKIVNCKWCIYYQRIKITDTQYANSCTKRCKCFDILNSSLKQHKPCYKEKSYKG